MSNPLSIQTLTFIFDNETDHLLMFQLAEDGPLKRKHSGLKGTVQLTEDLNEAARRSVGESTGLEVPDVVLRGVVKVLQAEAQFATIFFVYETSNFTGQPVSKIPGRLKWVDILNIFNLQMEGFVQEIMPLLLDGESFFEGSIVLDDQMAVTTSNLRMCNRI